MKKVVRLYPECKDNLWGGVALREKYGKKTDKDPVGESWELSFHKDGPTKIADGRTLQEAVTKKELGANCDGFPFFPMLIKFIDAKQDLSVQVHPSDDYALAHENSFGKTEMWYVVEAEPGAGLYVGFKRPVTKKEYEQAIANGTLTELLNFYEVKAGDCYFIPSGTIHAIGAGCLISEIQQNSNLTYRVYDYGRKDKNGNLRELHVEKALKVTSLEKYENRALGIQRSFGELIGASKYFTTTKIELDGSALIPMDKNTFKCVSVVEGQGQIGDEAFAAGDSFFLPADDDNVFVFGHGTLIVAEVRKYYVGIDLGGTFIKGGIVDDLGNIVYQDKAPTESEGGADKVAENIAALAKKLMTAVGLTSGDVVGLGMGVPGMIDSKAGTVIYSNNLEWEDFAIGAKVGELTGLPVKIANDANVAALGEVKFGVAKAYDNAILLTLGTGVGGGIVVDGKLVEGNRSAGAELGHSVIVMGGEQCTCGRKGCLEAYASATALIRDTKRAMLLHPESKMWEIGSIDDVTGKTAFDYKDTDVYAQEVVDGYLRGLACGIVNFANVFRPEVVILGGGVCAQGDNLVKPLQAILDEEIFAGAMGPQVKIVIAELGNSAGILGAAALLLDGVDGAEKTEQPTPIETPAAEEKAEDGKFLAALRLVVKSRKISMMELQRKLEIGYVAAGKLIDKMEEMGYISTSPNKVLLTKADFEKLYGSLDE
ncbi:MAG: ROK family protein [Clostridia bacterium]|nr:ROK family protein [Clostridia bacterium]